MSEELETGFFVVSCSGALKCGQVANAIAVKMDENGFAKMICLSAVSAGIEDCLSQVSKVKDLIIIDGCEKKCACKILDKINIMPLHEFCLTELGFDESADYDESEVVSIFRKKIKFLFGQSRSAAKYSVCGCDTCIRE